MKSTFSSSSSKRGFLILSAGTFFSFVTYSGLAYLSVILKSNGLSEESIGTLLSIYILPLLFSIPFSGKLVSRFGALRILQTGLSIVVLSYLSYQWSQYSAEKMVISRLLHGLGHGLFFPAAMFYAKTLLQGPSKIYFFGMYASMIPLANLIGPFLSESLFSLMGPRGLFFLNALPALMGVIMILSLRENKNSGGKSSNGEPHYAPILKETRFWSPSLTVFLTGLLFGYVISFLSLFLKQHSISVSYFFISFSLCLFISRFFMMRVLQKFRPFFLSSAGITLMTLSYTTLFFFASPLFTVISGIFLGLGFSVIYPVLSVHMTKCFSSEKQPAALALFNFFFQSGIYLTPLMGGFFIAKFGMKFFLGFLVGLGILGILITLFVKIRYTQKLKKH